MGVGWSDTQCIEQYSSCSVSMCKMDGDYIFLWEFNVICEIIGEAMSV